jgi:hypothetical protein
MQTDYVPRADYAFSTWLHPLVKYLQTKYADWGVPAAEMDALQSMASAFEEALVTAKEPATRTVVTVGMKNTTRKAVEHKVRAVVRSYVSYNPAVTNEDREAMQLTVRKTTRTRTPVADRPPYIMTEAAGPRRICFHFGGESHHSKAKPPGQHGAEIAWVIADTKPVEVEALTNSSVYTHTPMILTFKESERGKTLWHATRWENTRGERGPWSEIYSAVIP